MTDDLSRIASLARRERGRLAALARAEGLGPEDAVDCVQDGLCTLLQQAMKGALPPEPEAWTPLLAQMVKNAARNARRRHFRKKPHSDIDETAEETSLAAADDELLAAEAHIRLRYCVATLCDTQKSVVTLRMLEEVPGEDVARSLGISPEHVATLLYRAKRALRACMVEPESASAQR